MSFAPVVTKITPPSRRTDVLYRARLLDFLHEHIDRKLLLISAGAGYGKTTLLVDFVHETDLTCCWYSLEASDKDPRVFVEYLLASLERAYPGFGERTRRAVRSGAPLGGGAEEVVGTLVNEMVEQIPEWFVVILDDFQEVEDSDDVCSFLTTLLMYLPDHCHLIIASRTIPGGLPFISLAARGQVAGLGKDDLRFTAEEIQAFLNQTQGIRLSREEVAALEAETEGWIVGIILTRHVRWGGLLEGLTGARKAGKPLYEYLAGEVLEQQDEATRAFLLSSSILQEMSPLLCREALGLERAEEILEQLEQRNLFLVRIAGVEPPRFRYHALFQEFLQARLREGDPARYVALHRRAAAWFEARGKVDAAIRHYLEAGETLEAARLVDGVAWEMLAEGRLTTLSWWAERLPEEALRTYPRLLLSVAMAVSAAGKTEQAREWLSYAEQTFRQQGERTLLALTLSRLALLALNRGENEQAAERVREALSLTEDLPEPTEARVEARRILGVVLIRQGRFEEASRQLEAALGESRALGSHRREILILEGLAHSFRWQGRLRRAVETQRAAVEAARQQGSPGLLAEALNDLGFYLYLSGDYAEAWRGLEEALHIARTIGHPLVEAYAQVSLGELLRDLGEPQAAVELLDEGRRLAEVAGNVFLVSWTYEALALAFLRLGDATQATELARSALSMAERQHFGLQQGRFRATLGLAMVEDGLTEAGLEELKAACDALEQLNAKEEAVRARLLYALALRETGRVEEAKAVLQTVPGDGEWTDQQRLLPLQFPALVPLLEWAVEQGGNGERFGRLLAEAHRLARKARQVQGQRTPPQPPHRPSFRFYGFGVGRAERDGVLIPSAAWESAKARHLLFYLLSHSPATREQIGADLWPDLRPNRLPGTFHNTKYRVQRALGVVPFTYEERGYRISGDLDYWFDVEEFEQLVQKAKRAPPVKAVRYLSRAVELYTADFLTDCYDEWCVARRDQLQRQFLEAADRLARWFIERERFDRAVEVLRRGLEVDPLREDFHRQMMRAYALQGQREEALAVYRRCQARLRGELGVEPAPETQALARQIREGRLGAGSEEAGSRDTGRRKKR